MTVPDSQNAPERIARKVVMDCADCDCCRPIMDESCLFFPELYRLYDQEVETGQKISAEELRQLVEKCNYCALCPCPNTRADIIRAKTRFIERDGLKFGVRIVEDEPVRDRYTDAARYTVVLAVHSTVGKRDAIDKAKLCASALALDVNWTEYPKSTVRRR